MNSEEVNKERRITHDLRRVYSVPQRLERQMNVLLFMLSATQLSYYSKIISVVALYVTYTFKTALARKL